MHSTTHRFISFQIIGSALFVLFLSAQPTAAFGLFGTIEAKAPLRQGYTCRNRHYQADWGSQAIIPADTPARDTDYGRCRVTVELVGKPMRLGLDYGREQMIRAPSSPFDQPAAQVRWPSNCHCHV